MPSPVSVGCLLGLGLRMAISGEGNVNLDLLYELGHRGDIFNGFCEISRLRKQANRRSIDQLSWGHPSRCINGVGHRRVHMN